MIFEFLIGVLSALGIYFVMSVVVRPRVPLWVEIAPYVSVVEFPTPNFAKRIGERVKSVIQERPHSLAGSDREVSHLLMQAGDSVSLAEFRKEQVTYSALGVMLVAGWLALRTLEHKPVAVIAAIVLSAVIASGGLWLAKWQLVQTVTKRRRSAEGSLPAVLELLAFSVSAGEPMLSSLQRVTQTCAGPLVDDLRIALTDIAMGVSLVDSFTALGDRVNSPQIVRSLKAIAIAIERGTPLAEILRAQASDARAARLRDLLVAAGKKETAMMFPVVFLILPMIVAVALYPGFIALQGM